MEVMENKVMTAEHTAELNEELRQFQAERDKIRNIVGRIGGVASLKQDRIVTIVFALLLIMLLILDAARNRLHIYLPLPPLFSLEVGILLVSIKIIWMMHRQTRIEHFQFWILSSIEFRLDKISKLLHAIENRQKESAEGKAHVPESPESEVEHSFKQDNE
jgi:hypothetical protein